MLLDIVRKDQKVHTSKGQERRGGHMIRKDRIALDIHIYSIRT
jgi:hypothetical protein